MSETRILWDALADAEIEVQKRRKENLKLRELLVRHLCDCRRLSMELPLEPNQHRLTCTYRQAMGLAFAKEAQARVLDFALDKLFP